MRELFLLIIMGLTYAYGNILIIAVVAMLSMGLMPQAKRLDGKWDWWR